MENPSESYILDAQKIEHEFEPSVAEKNVNDEEKKSIVKNELFKDKDSQFCVTSSTEVNGANEAILSPDQKTGREVAKAEGTLPESQVPDSNAVFRVEACGGVSDISSLTLPTRVMCDDNAESTQPQTEYKNLVVVSDGLLSNEKTVVKASPVKENEREGYNSLESSVKSIQESQEVEMKADRRDFNDFSDGSKSCGERKECSFTDEEFNDARVSSSDVGAIASSEKMEKSRDEDKCLRSDSDSQSSKLVINESFLLHENGNDEILVEEEEGEEEINNGGLANEAEAQVFQKQGVGACVDTNKKKFSPVEKENLPNGNVEEEKLGDLIAMKKAELDKEECCGGSKEKERLMGFGRESEEVALKDMMDDLLETKVSKGRELTPAGEDQVDADQGSVEVDFMVGDDDVEDDENGSNGDDEEEDDSVSENVRGGEEDDTPEALILDAPEKIKCIDKSELQREERLLPTVEDSYVVATSKTDNDFSTTTTTTSKVESMKVSLGEDDQTKLLKHDELEASSSSNETETSEMKKLEECVFGVNQEVNEFAQQSVEATTATALESVVERSIDVDENASRVRDTSITYASALESTVTEDRLSNEGEEVKLPAGKDLPQATETFIESEEIIATTKPLDKVATEEQFGRKTSNVTADEMVNIEKVIEKTKKESGDVDSKKDVEGRKSITVEDKLDLITGTKLAHEETKKEQMHLPLKSAVPSVSKIPTSQDKTSTRKETDNDSGVDETTQAKIETSPTKNTPTSLKGVSRKQVNTISPSKSFQRFPSPTKAVLSPTKHMASARGPAGATSPGSKMSPHTRTTPTGEQKKLPMNKIVVGLTASPNLKEVKSKVGSMSNMTHRPGGGTVKVETKHTDYSQAKSKVGSVSNITYKPGGGAKKIESKKLEWNVGSKIGSLDNARHKPGGGDKKIETVKVDFKDKAKAKVGSTANVKHEPGGGKIQIEDHKLTFKDTAASKVGSMDNVGHKPGGGEVKIFDEAGIKQRSKSEVSWDDQLSGGQSPRSVSPGPPQNGLTPSSEEVIPEESARMNV